MLRRGLALNFPFNICPFTDFTHIDISGFMLKNLNPDSGYPAGLRPEESNCPRTGHFLTGVTPALPEGLYIPAQYHCWGCPGRCASPILYVHAFWPDLGNPFTKLSLHRYLCLSNRSHLCPVFTPETFWVPLYQYFSGNRWMPCHRNIICRWLGNAGVIVCRRHWVNRELFKRYADSITIDRSFLIDSCGIVWW